MDPSKLAHADEDQFLEVRLDVVQMGEHSARFLEPPGAHLEENEVWRGVDRNVGGLLASSLAVALLAVNAVHRAAGRVQTR